MHPDCWPAVLRAMIAFVNSVVQDATRPVFNWTIDYVGDGARFHAFDRCLTWLGL